MYNEVPKKEPTSYPFTLQKCFGFPILETSIPWKGLFYRLKTRCLIFLPAYSTRKDLETSLAPVPAQF